MINVARLPASKFGDISNRMETLFYKLKLDGPVVDFGTTSHCD
jgi:hypothetical protein